MEGRSGWCICSWAEVYGALESLIVVIGRGAHDLSTKFTEDSTLFWFGVDVGPHLLGGAVDEHNFALVNFVFDVEILYLNVFSVFGAAGHTVSLEEDCAHIVLLDQRRFHVVALLRKEVSGPKDIGQGVIHPDEFRLRRAFCVNFLFP